MNADTENKTLQTTEYPDKTKFYVYEKAKEILGETKPMRILLPDAILLLLYAQPDNPIFGRVSLMKQVYLLTKEVLNRDEVQDARFVPYYYGWYSFQVINDVRNLEFLGYLTRKGKTNSTSEQFQISQKGKKHINKIFSTLSESLQTTIKEKRKGWDQLGCEGILRYMYTKYPESKERARLKERYKTIKWGRSRG
jgi:uncharacterized protein YwgA